jgi:hypothetical protein
MGIGQGIGQSVLAMFVLVVGVWVITVRVHDLRDLIVQAQPNDSAQSGGIESPLLSCCSN